MKLYFGFAKGFLLLMTPLIASSVLATSPSLAATFASSEGNFEFQNFSQSPSSTLTDTNTNTLAIGNAGTVAARAQASATFIVTPPQASNSSLSVALGENRDYLGLAESQATVIGNFDVNANTLFSFDFTSSLNLKTAIDNPPAENARASGDISFALLDTVSKSVLDFFSLSGNLVTPGGNDFIAIQNSDNVAVNILSKNYRFGGNQESATASVQGSLKHFFTHKTDLALIEVKTNQASVVAPEPSANLALLLCSGVIGIALKGRRTKNTSAC